MSQFFGEIPRHGVWDSVGLDRGQFLGIILISTLLFVWIGGPVWFHLRTSHMARIGWSYAVIPLLVMAALWRNGRLTVSRLAGATVLVSTIKFLLTAALLVAFAIAKI